MHKLRLVGVRTVWHTTADGEFFCSACGGDRNYRHRSGRRRLTVLGVPVLARGDATPVVECSSCRGHFGPEVLDRPTTTRFSAMLRDAVHTVTLAVLAAGGATTPAVRERAVATVRAAGFTECTEEQLVTLLAALAADPALDPRPRREGPAGPHAAPTFGALHPAATVLALELHDALRPLAPHLQPAGRERLLHQAARVALADGPFTPTERELLHTVGAVLLLDEAVVTALLEEADQADPDAA
ncbi:TerB family tellurite resistance protein [Streptomyces sp. NPDC059740]|uniref:TerB family tellurite resistance protein n=1 Tax=Streptomyces sp. NPDC059740 TaxID=3346926 RepID=UPI0036585B0C